MLRRVPYNGAPAGLTVMNVDAVDDDVALVMDSDARPAGDVDASTSAVDGLERVHQQLLLKLDHHVPLEDDPQRLVLDHRVPESSGPEVHRVVVAGVGDHVNPAVLAAHRVLPEPNGAIRQPLPVALPIRIAPPAIVNWVAGATRQVSQVPPRRIDSPAHHAMKQNNKAYWPFVSDIRLKSIMAFITYV